MSLFLQRLVLLRGILFREQEHRQERIDVGMTLWPKGPTRREEANEIEIGKLHESGERILVFTGTAEAESKNKPFGKAKRGSVNRSVRRVMMGVAGLAVLGMTAMLAGAQTVGVKEKPPLYRYVSYWTFPRAHWADVDKDNTTGNQKILAPALADGTLVGYGADENLVHSAESFTHDNWWQANSITGLMKVIEAFHKGGGSSSPLLVSATKHWDQIYISSFYNWKAGSWKGAYGYSGTYKLKPDAPDPDDAVRTLSRFYVPVFEKMLADGTIIEYEIDRETIHTTDSRAQVHFSFVMPNAEGLDKFQAALGAALDENSLIGPAFGSMMVNFTPQADFVQVNATYK